MGKGNDLGLLELLKSGQKGGDQWSALTARTPDHDPADEAAGQREAKLNDALRRINQLTTADGRKAAPPPLPAAATTSSADAIGAAPNPVAAAVEDAFVPIEPPTV